MIPCSRAVILAAGRGTRLRPHTVDRPKCMVCVFGVPLVEYMLRDLAVLGIEDVLIVTGYRAEVIRARVGGRFRGMRIRYVHCPEYATTNNIVSLWRARTHITAPFLLLESDLLLELPVLAPLLVPDRVALSPYRPGHDGTVARVSAAGVIERLLLGRDQRPGESLHGTYKTVNACSLTAHTWRNALVPRIDAMVAAGRVNEFYEAAMAAAIDAGDARLHAIDVSARRWIEIDTPADLALAETVFRHHKAGAAERVA